MLDLVLPLRCGGCGEPAARWCSRCAAEWAVRPDHPHLINPRLDPGVPVFSLGRYAGARRRAIVAVKEHGRIDLLAPLAAALTGGVDRLLRWGIVPASVTMVPAPTRAGAARRRGGDPVARMVAGGAERLGLTAAPMLRMAARARDSVGLTAAARQRNVAGRVVLRRRYRAGALAGALGDVPVLLVDDICTTGATVDESVRVLGSAGMTVAAVLVLAHA
ncbi:ComF family protein [Mycobacterium koreense]|uniref:Phosphoribosyltransferase n=1 Tax=Mycolicibacillus koreensis TaxID=1069220 RepID=A0AA91SSQ8_9MYCO|nr:ComF family protein [Mycolicibacillus koreensis]MCV7249899.1 ComF family protein [Mycolicibacillus koreensis]ODR11242.1 phosphoribosyltransferase [Mycolicibacillus koreensis]OSC34881.1 phosphoribosyltransferase [Mycolicibacillus koreensis]